MSWDCFARLTLPTWALTLSDVARTVDAGDSPVERATDRSDGTTVLEGRPHGGEFLDLEAVLKVRGIAFDCFAEDPGDGSVETCIRRVFRPNEGGPTHEAEVPVTRADVPVLPLDVWDALAGTPGGPVAWAAVQQRLGLPADTVAEWAARHPAI